MDAGQLKIKLADRAEEVCRHLLPKGQRTGGEWRCGSVDGEPGQSLGVVLNGEKAGLWRDFAGDKGGDLLDLYCAVKGASLADAIRWAKDFLGIQDPQFHAMPAKEYRRPVVKNVRTPQNGALDYLTKARALNPATIKAFQLGEQAGRSFPLSGGRSHTCSAVVFPFKTGPDGELKLVKYLGVDRPATEDKPDGMRLMSAEANCEPILFGWQAMPPGARAVVICEGELNAASWHQFGFPALATPLGAGKGNKHNWIASEWDRLAQFETIYLNFDEDKPGREAVEELVERLGRHRCRVVPPMPNGHKDVNDCLRFGIDPAEMRATIESAKSSDPKELRSAGEFADDVVERFYPGEDTHAGVPMPFEGFGDKFAFRLGETTVMTGMRGHGKTQAINFIHAKAMARGERVCIASLEMRAPVLLQRMVRQLTAQRVPSEAYIRKAMQWLTGRLWIYDHVGTVDRKRILDVFEYAARRYGIRYFVIDSLMKCRIDGDDYNSQDAFVDDLDNFDQRLGVHTLLVAHARKKEDESQIAGNNDVKGSGGITDKACNVISIWRNKEKEIGLQKTMLGEPLTRAEEASLKRPDCVWYVDKQREGDGWIGTVGLDFDPDSQQFITAHNPVQPIVRFSDPQDSDEYEEVSF